MNKYRSSVIAGTEFVGVVFQDGFHGSGCSGDSTTGFRCQIFFILKGATVSVQSFLHMFL